MHCRRLPVVIGLIAGSFFITATGWAIRDGFQTNELPKTVMALETRTSTGMFLGYGTATNIFAPRCLLTAGHVVQAVTAGESWAFQGENVKSGGKWQLWEKFVPRDGSVREQDLAVIWLQNSKAPPEAVTPRMQEPGDYSHIEYGGLFPASETGTSMMGYGKNMTGSGAGIKRKGYAKYTAYNPGTNVNPPLDGGWYHIDKGPTGQFTCGGDSGGPLFRMGNFAKTYGVASAVGSLNGPECGTGFLLGMIYTSIDSAKIQGGTSNKEWVDQTTTDICTKKALFIPMDFHGSVTGTLQNYRYIYSDMPQMNGSISCALSGGSDCVENVHYQESLSVTAVPYSGWQFSSWLNGGGSLKPCPCVGQGANCTIEYDDIGYYDEEISSDEAICIASFQPAGGGSSGGSGG